MHRNMSREHLWDCAVRVVRKCKATHRRRFWWSNLWGRDSRMGQCVGLAIASLCGNYYVAGFESRLALLSKALYHTCFICGQRCKRWFRRPKLTSSVISDVKPIIYILHFVNDLNCTRSRPQKTTHMQDTPTATSKSHLPLLQVLHTIIWVSTILWRVAKIQDGQYLYKCYEPHFRPPTTMVRSPIAGTTVIHCEWQAASPCGSSLWTQMLLLYDI